uniref:Uncharacterized protein n=1 Tax=Vitis vinifera TaxID=29760 RepID=A5C0R0_VITVI|nr:hypothetical protein VITISV_014584 [Vitis vinifera]
MTQSNGARLKHGIDDHGKQLWELNKSMHKSTQILEHKVYEELFSSQESHSQEGLWSLNMKDIRWRCLSTHIQHKKECQGASQLFLAYGVLLQEERKDEEVRVGSLQLMDPQNAKVVAKVTKDNGLIFEETVSS